MIELSAVKLQNVGVAALVLAVTCTTLPGACIAHSTVIITVVHHILCDILVAIKA